ncbi:MAG TPA: outer membrane protein assembly factor BamD [Candidatus Angelobacter sp.]
MLRKLALILLLTAPFFLTGCHHKVKNPIANIDSKQPDKVLFDRAMDSMKHGHYTEARTLLETLINTYPDSEYVARAKLSVGDSYYAEGGTAQWAQAEVQYKDFQTFFPNMPEAAEAQLKVATIHYKQMEKPDRDFNQAMRAADEYKALIQQYPDSKLVPEAKQRLREVQEILAERQARIAHFYYLRNNLAAAQARLTSLVSSYPLYSGVDDAWYSLGGIYEKEAATMRQQQKLPEAMRAKLAAEYDQKAIESYSRIITRYPAMDRATDARKRLEALKAPVPTPTPEALAESKAEEESRGSSGRFHSIMSTFRKHPDVNKASEVGEPNLEEEQIISASAVVQHLDAEIKEAAVKVGTGPAPGANQPPPSSTTDDTSATSNAGGGSNGSASANGSGSATGQSNQSPSGGASTPPARTNDIGAASNNGSQNSAQSSDNSQQNTNDQQDSSSKKKKKKGLRKIIPF